jgi:ABC-type branched-subunit amino acid transport system ATPase component
MRRLPGAGTPATAPDRGSIDEKGAAAIDIQSVTVEFDGLKALSAVSLAAGRGQILGVIGPNGAGKTTLLNCISGLQRTTSGCISIFGQDVTARPAHVIARLGVGRTFQAPSVVGRLTALENVMLGYTQALRSSAVENMLWVGRTRRDERKARAAAREALDFLGAADLADRPARQLAHGQLRVVELARVLVTGAKLMLLDEPTSGMTGDERDEIGVLLGRVREETGATLVVIEHDVSFIRRLSERLVVLSFGEVLATGDPEVVLADPEVRLHYLGRAASESVAGGRPPRPADGIANANGED